jgi:hypothetical protein
MAYHCSYRLNGELFVVAIPGAQNPSATIGKLNDECAEAAAPLPDIGEYATRCTGPDHEEIIAVGKRTHGQTRIAQFYVPLTRGDVYLSIAKLLGDRL